MHIFYEGYDECIMYYNTMLWNGNTNHREMEQKETNQQGDCKQAIDPNAMVIQTLSQEVH